MTGGPARRLAALAALGVALAAAGCDATASARTTSASPSATGGSPTRPAATLHGFPLSVPVSRPQVTLVDTAGQPYPFAERTRGRVTLVYLGYTHCTDTCPAMMATLAEALRRVPAQVAGRVTVVFVTTDPRRDTPRVIRAWLDRFNPAFVGLTGTPAALAATYRAFGMDPRVIVEPGGAEQVEHSADMFAFGPDNRAWVTYDPSATPSDYIHDLPLLEDGVTPPLPSAADLASAGGTGRAGLVKAFSAFLAVSGKAAELRLTLLNGGDPADSVDAATAVGGGVAQLLVAGKPAARISLVPDIPVTVGGRVQIRFGYPAAAPRPGSITTVSLTLAGNGLLTMRVPVVAAR